MKIGINISSGASAILGGLRLGANVFVGGDMSSATGFTLEAGWTIADGVGHAIATGAPTSLIKFASVTNSKTYRLEFDMSNYVSGNLDVIVGTVNLPDMAENGHYSVDFTTDAAGNNVLFMQGYSLTADIDNISFREIL